MEQLSKDDLLELAVCLGKDVAPEVSMEQWPVELRSLYKSFVDTDSEAEVFAQQLVRNQELDRLLVEAMTDVQVPGDLRDRVLSFLQQETRDACADDLDLVQPKLAEVRDASDVDVRRRQSLQLISAMVVLIFGFVLWPIFVSDRNAGTDVADVQQSIEPWVAELDQKETSREVVGEVASIVQALQEVMPVGAKVRHAIVGDGHLALDFSSPRNGQVIVFVLEQNAIEVLDPQFEVLQVSGPFAAAMGRIGKLKILIVTNESMKRVSEFLPG
ncbi:MAG: hypothetical protein VX776_05295 [Planctomycetota bacterium]|nr:hypothetical protein [Planctomycetota bacterium]